MNRNHLLLALSVVTMGLLCCSSAHAAPTESTRDASKPTTTLPTAHRNAVEKSLQFLTEIQKPDGHWESLPGEPRSLLAMHGKMTMVLTSVSGLALLAEGSTTTSGEHQKRLVLARDYLLRIIGDSKDFKLPSYPAGVVKTHIANEVPFMLVFLNEIYRTDKDPKLKEALQLVANFVSDAQSPEGGWDYTYKNTRHGHTATVIQNVFALALLRNSGIKVADKTIDRAIEFIKGREPSSKEKPGYVQYGDGSKKTSLEPGITNRAAGTLVMLCHLKRQSDPLWERSVKFHRQALNRKFIYGGHSPAYQHFMVGTASSLLGPKSWTTYVDVFGKSHIEAQSKNGQWPTTRGNSDRSHPHGGVVFETALTTMILQIPLKHLSFTSAEH